MSTEYKYQGETFLLDDSKGCYIEVTYRDQLGHVGVNLQGTKDAPYAWSVNRPSRITADGLSSGVSSGPDEESNLLVLCHEMLRLQREAEARKAFNREAACKSLHEFVEALADGKASRV